MKADITNRGCTQEAIDIFETSRASTTSLDNKSGVCFYAPGKAANCGGVAVSGLEMAQNSQRVCVALRLIILYQCSRLFSSCGHLSKLMRNSKISWSHAVSLRPLYPSACQTVIVLFHSSDVDRPYMLGHWKGIFIRWCHPVFSGRSQHCW